VRLVTLPGVFKPISDSRMLAGALRRETLPAGARVLDLCTGSGLLALTAALRGVRDVTAVDVSRRALLTVRLNARLNGVAIRTLRGSLFEPVAGEQFDAIVSNPPYVPAASDELPTRGACRAWEAGRDGRALLDRILAEAPAHLAPGGRLLVVHSSILDFAATERALAAAGLTTEVAGRARGPLGPLMTANRELLEARGMLRPGEDEEEVHVIRARRPAEVRSAAPGALR
jgi:release factor glutamine methyltransferase